MPGLGVGAGVFGGLLPPILVGGVLGAGAGITLMALGSELEAGKTEEAIIAELEADTKAHSVVEKVKAHSVMESRKPMRGFAASFA
mmetsp:Transcript_5451/g.13469  ORF Transcript_5451/g.13469 Transcript_5451/m.13469 type:complete len:86 (+) Transcript_5451:78-335(+)